METPDSYKNAFNKLTYEVEVEIGTRKFYYTESETLQSTQVLLYYRSHNKVTLIPASLPASASPIRASRLTWAVRANPSDFKYPW